MELNEPTFIEHPEEDNDEAPGRSKRKGQRNALKMISSYTSWMTLPRPLQRPTLHLMMTIGKKQ
jgi:hypothetical protein